MVTQAQPATQRVVFVIDDDPLVLSALGSLIELETPHRVRRFTSGPAALAALERERPDLVISDLTMPGMDGIEVLRRARELVPRAARIVLTGYADKDSAVRAINEAGIFQYVEKPWDNALLLVVIGNALDHVELERRLEATVEELTQRNRELERAIAELRDAQDRLVHAERLAAVGRVASGIAHEIGNQLSLLGYAELLAERYAGDPGAQELIHPLTAAKRRLGAMVGQIKDFVRGAGVSYARERQPLGPIVDEALAVLRFEPAMKTRHIERPARGEVFARVNREKMMQVVLNLVRNALQATREGGRLTIDVREEAGQAVLEVADDGAGIAAADQERIWEPFFSTKGEMGTGLGLGICRRIVEEHDGTITCRSPSGAGGAGATFTVTLPVAAAPT